MGDITKLNVTVKVSQDYDVDVPAFFRAHLDEYLRWKPDHPSDCPETWERPSAFLHEYMAEDSGLGPDDGQTIKAGVLGDVEVRFNWTKEDYAALVAAVPEVDPEHPAAAPEAIARRPGPLDVPLPLLV